MNSSLGVRLRARTADVLGEYRARRELNRGQSNADYAAAEDYARKYQNEAHASATAALREAEVAAEQKRNDATERADRTRFENRSSLDGLLASAEFALREESQKIPGPFGRLQDRVSAETLTVPPSHGVIGAVSGTEDREQPVPVVIPLLGQKGLLLRGSATAATEVVDAMFARLIASISLSSLYVTRFDPEDIGGLLGTFGELGATMADRFKPASYSPDVLRTQLEGVLGRLQRNTERIRSSGNRNILSIWESATPKMVVEVLVIDDRPGTMDDQTRKLLRRIIDSGPASGAFVILLQTGDRVDRTSSRNAFDERTPEQIDDELYLDDKLNLITLDERTDDAVLCLPQGDLTIRPIGGVNHLSVQELIGQVATLQSQQTGPVVGPERLLPVEGTASAAQGIEVNIGDRENGSPLKFELRSANPPRSNALIGGAVGTGKSNLLHTLVYSIAAKYRREEVEMMLLDFKSGTEFQRYARQSNSAGNGTSNWLPNARLVGLESDRAFGLSVLEELLFEMDRRADAFKAAGTSDYDSFRSTGEVMPRLVTIIDEFQTLFENDDEIAASAVEALTKISRKGRAFGIHLVLSTQTLSGIRQLSMQGDAIFGQMQVRIALKLGRNDSQLMLAQGNTAAARLQHRGEVVVNNNTGEDEDHNITGVVTHAEIGYTTQLQERLFTEANTKQPPRLFRGTDYAPRAESTPRPRTLGLGQAVNVAGTEVVHEFTQNPLRALAILGSDQMVTRELEVSAIHSGFRSGSYEQIIVIGNARLLDLARSLQTETGIPADLVTHDEAAAWILGHEEQLRQDRTLVVITELPSIVSIDEPINASDSAVDREEEAAKLFAPVDDDAVFGDVFASTSAGWNDRTAASVLTDLAKSSKTRSDLVISAQLFSTLERIFGYDRDGGNGIAAYALARVPLQELRQFLGYGAEQTDESPRFIYSQAGSGMGGVLTIPFGGDEAGEAP